MLQSIASSLCLYSGQMCTAPQNIFIARTGVDTDVGHKSFEEIAAAIREAVRSLLSDPARAEAILGCIQSTATLERIRRVTAEGPVLLQSNSPHYPSAPNARAATPIIRRVTVADRELFAEEKFGPISYIVATDSSAESIQVARDLAREKGAITMGVYSMSPHVLEEARRAAAQAGVGLSCNFLGNLLINQNAAFSDYHVSGANPAGTACMTDGAFVASRFRVAASRAAMREQP
jgi:acyl-CoA reductase-like NAD-dependent aldehyde dehydrogenase